MIKLKNICYQYAVYKRKWSLAEVNVLVSISLFSIIEFWEMAADTCGINTCMGKLNIVLPCTCSVD